MKRKKYSPEFKLKVVKEAIETGNNSLVARNHQLGSSMVSRWVRQYKAVGESNFLAGKTPKQEWNNTLFTDKEKKELVREKLIERFQMRFNGVVYTFLRPYPLKAEGTTDTSESTQNTVFEQFFGDN